MAEEGIRGWGYKIVDILADEYSDLDARPPVPLGEHSDVLEGFFGGELPEDGCSPETLLDVIQNGLLPHSPNQSYSGVFCSVSGAALPFPALVETLVSALRLYVFDSSLSPASNKIEQTVVRWLGQFIGYSQNAAGYVATGGTTANLMGLLTARVAQLGTAVNESGMHGEKPLTAYASEYVHECMDQSMRMMGLGSRQLRKIPVDEEFRVRIGLLEKMIIEDLEKGFRPFCVVGVAGVTATGAVDDLNALADIAEKYGLWFHVDGAYGAFAASLPHKKLLFSGINRADSIVCDPHKWLNVPLEAGVILVKDWQCLKNAFALNVECMGSMNGGDEHHQWEHGFELSRRDRALKVWLAIKQYGAASYRELVGSHIQLTEYMAAEISASPFLELVIPTSLSVCCFRYLNKEDGLMEADIDRLNKAIVVYMRKAGGPVLGSIEIADRVVLRACIVSYRVTQGSVDKLIGAVVEAGHQCSRMAGSGGHVVSSEKMLKA